jgi:hypothetical protein
VIIFALLFEDAEAGLDILLATGATSREESVARNGLSWLW